MLPLQAEGVVFKIVPMEGGTPVNGEQQKRAPDILAEVDISLRLSRLRGEPGRQKFARAFPVTFYTAPSVLAQRVLHPSQKPQKPY